MGGDSFTIVPEKKVYYPGQALTGLFHIELENPMKIKEISVVLKGKGHVFWTEGGGQNTRYYWNNETYFNISKVIYGKEQTHQDEFEIPRGQNSYPFSITIPTQPLLPPSFEVRNNYIRYTLKGIVNRPWSTNKKAKVVINLNTLLDLNSIRDRDVTSYGETKGTKTICCLCCESDPIKGVVQTERKGYVPGDTVVFHAEINNMSRRRIKKSKCVLLMIVTLKSAQFGHNRTMAYKLAKTFHGPIESGGTDVYRNERLTIPPVPPTLVMGSKVMDIRYYLGVVAVPAGPSLNLRVNSEIIIGSIPLNSVASQQGVTIPSVPAVIGASADIPSGLYDDTILESIPQATIAESMFEHYDAINKKKKKVEPRGENTKAYKALYTYYKWNNQDPADLFSVSHT